MTEQIRNIILCVLAVLFFIVCIKRGYGNGLTIEIKKLLSIAVAVICILLILVLKRAVSEHQYGTVIVVAGAIVILSFGWKFIRMIIGLLSGLKELPILGSLDAILGGLAGAVEGAAVIWIIYKVFCAFTGQA